MSTNERNKTIMEINAGRVSYMTKKTAADNLQKHLEEESKNDADGWTYKVESDGERYWIGVYDFDGFKLGDL